MGRVAMGARLLFISILSVLMLSTGCTEKSETGKMRHVAGTDTGVTGEIPVPPEGMVFVKGGSFWAGSTESEIDRAWKMSLSFVGRFTKSRRVWYEDEEYRFVRIRDFFMDKYEVTVGDYRQFLAVAGSTFTMPKEVESLGLSDDMPVVGVTHGEAEAYAEWVGKRLPEVYEWEWAARGSERRWFPWGEELPDGTRANYADRRTMLPWRDTEHDDGFSGIAPVGSYPGGQTPEGIMDLAGNAREWTASGATGVIDPRDGRIYPWWNRRILPEWKRLNPVEMYYVKGGSWNSAADDLRASDIRMLPPDSRMNALGFRCVKDACVHE